MFDRMTNMRGVSFKAGFYTLRGIGPCVENKTAIPYLKKDYPGCPTYPPSSNNPMFEMGIQVLTY